MLIRYFNGIEQKIPIKENIIQVDRFTISKDGFNIVIQGLSLKENRQAQDGKLSLMNGLFIYQINKDDIRKVSLVQFIPFAQITPPKPPEQKRLDFVAGELENECATFGHYEQYNGTLQYYGDISAEKYQETFKFEELEQSDDENEEIKPPSIKRAKSIF